MLRSRKEKPKFTTLFRADRRDRPRQCSLSLPGLRIPSARPFQCVLPQPIADGLAARLRPARRYGLGRDSPVQMTSSVRGSIRCIWLRSATSRIDSPARPAEAGLTRPQTSTPSTMK
jgi:hypothetical protein